MRFTLGIDMGNAAFEDNPDELTEQLLHLANRLRFKSKDEATTGLVLDNNGNTVGSWTIE
jgi:hypothetical protein